MGSFPTRDRTAGNYDSMHVRWNSPFHARSCCVMNGCVNTIKKCNRLGSVQNVSFVSVLVFGADPDGATTHQARAM